MFSFSSFIGITKSFIIDTMIVIGSSKAIWANLANSLDG